ncbi:hypothetical protein SLA2020_107090 [Shorea laevis]
MATIIVPDQVSAVKDAEALRRARKGCGTDEKTIISILGHRNAAQRMQIRLAYLQLIKKILSSGSNLSSRAISRLLILI